MTYIIDIARCNATLAVKNILSQIATDLVGPAGGDLSGFFPAPIVSKINGVLLGSTTATAGNILIGSGSSWVSNPIAGDITISSSGVSAIGANKVLDTMIRQSAGLSIIGRSANTTGNVADITAASDFQVMRRSGTAIAFGSVNLASGNAVTGILPNANTTATNTPGVANSIVLRDVNGEFAATTASSASAASTVGMGPTSTNATYYLGFFANAGPSFQSLNSNAALTFNPSTGVLSATSITGALTGNASTATALQTARNIGGVSFDGTGNIVPQTIQSINEASDTTCFLLFISGSGTQSLQPLNNANLRFNASTNLFATNLLSVDNGGAGLTGTNAALIFGASGVGDGNYINFGSGGRNIGVFNGGNFFFTANADYDATANVYKYNSSNPATAIETGTASIDLKYAVSGTSGNTITFLNGLSISVAGAVSIPNGDLSLTRSNSGGDVNVTATNSSNTASSNARLNMSVAGSSAGDPYITYDISGVGGFCHGVDNSDSDAFVIAASSALGTTNVVRIDSSTKDVGVVAGNLAVQTIGKGLVIKSGSNARVGTGTLSGGSLAVPNTSITANTRIFLQHLVVAGTQGFLKPTTVVNGGGFTITSSSGTDTSTVSWLLVESS